MKAKSEQKNGKLAWIAWTAAVVFYFYQGCVRVAPSVMEHELALEFSVTSATLAIALGAFYFVYSPLQLFVGILFDKLGGKTILVPASVLVAIGCILPAMPSNSLLFITIGRVFTGIGASCAFIGVMYIAAVWFHDNRLAFLSGLATSIGFAGSLTGQAPLSLLIDSTGWRASWIWMAIAGIIITVTLAICVPKTPYWEHSKRTENAESLSFKNFLSGLISVCKNKQTWLIGLVASCMYMPTVVFGDLWGIQYIQCSLGLQKAQAAEVAGMLYIGWLVGGPLAGLLSDMIKCRRKLLTIGCFLSTILFLIILICPIKSAFTIGALLFLAGVTSSPEVVCFVASLEVNKYSAKGSAIAVVNMIVMLIGGIFQPIVGWLIDLNSPCEVCHTISPDAFKTALLTMPLLTFVGLVLSVFIKKGINVRD